MSDLIRAFEVIAAVCAGLEQPTRLVWAGGRLFGPALPGQRRPRKPWRVGVDPAAFSLILQIEEIDAAWMPLAGGSQADGLEMIADSINAHVGIELDLPAGRPERLRAPDAATLARLHHALRPGPVAWDALAALAEG